MPAQIDEFYEFILNKLEKLCEVKMTKLAEWLSILTILAGVWYAQNFGNILSTDFYHPILTFWWPVGLVLVFGLACLFVIVYRVITFNDCEEASKELQQQIEEAKEDLKSKGLKF